MLTTENLSEKSLAQHNNLLLQQIIHNTFKFIVLNCVSANLYHYFYKTRLAARSSWFRRSLIWLYQGLVNNLRCS